MAAIVLIGEDVEISSDFVPGDGRGHDSYLGHVIERSNPDYPDGWQHITFVSLSGLDSFIASLQELRKLWDADIKTLPECCQQASA